MVVPQVAILVTGGLAGGLDAAAATMVMMLVIRHRARDVRRLVHAPRSRRRAEPGGCERQTKEAEEKAE